MGEQLFTHERYESSLRSLQEFPQQLIGAYDLKHTVQSSETWIPYENQLRIVEGWVLKQGALRDIEANRPDGPGIQRFCAFVAKTEYVD